MREHVFNGTTRTLLFNAELRIVPVDNRHDIGPKNCSLADATEIGATWKCLCNADRRCRTAPKKSR